MNKIDCDYYTDECEWRPCAECASNKHIQPNEKLKEISSINYGNDGIGLSYDEISDLIMDNEKRGEEMRLFYIKNSILELGNDFAAMPMSKKELNLAIKDLDDKDYYVEYKLGKGNTDGWWCKELGEAIESTPDYCGNQCGYYDPRNGGTGMCKYLSPCVIETGKTYGK